MMKITYEDIPEYIVRYGKKATKSLLKSSELQIQIPNNEEILLHGFNKKCINTVKLHLRNGKQLHYLNKKNGKVKKQYYGYTIVKYINELDIEQSKYNEHLLLKLYNRFCNKYKKEFENIDMQSDPITFEKIYDPCYIIPDWNNGCKIIYNYDTLLKCKATRRVYTGFDTDDNGETIYYYRDIFEGYYISPFTKRRFYNKDIKFISSYIIEDNSI